MIPAQKEDYNWVMGVGASESDSIYKINKISFPNDSFKAYLVYRSIPFYRTLGVVSDSVGQLLCYTNGLDIYNRNHEVMDEGGGIELTSQFPFGYPVTQGVLILPIPDNLGYYIMIGSSHMNIGTTTICNKLHYSIIDIFKNNGLGKVIEKKITFYNNDSLNIGHIAAVRHGNGRDWWLSCTKFNSNTIHFFIVSPSGITDISEQNIGDTFFNGDGNSVFSPSGEWYANYTVFGNASNPNAKLYLYHFDRCEGILREPQYRFFAGPNVYGGVAFSSNSRYLYVSKFNQVLQYDLQATDVLSSEQVVADYDNYLDEGGAPTRFYGLQLAPDGKIYGNIPNFNSRYLHVIDQPDLPGDSCNVIQHAVYLPAHNFGTLPNLPYYRLYAEEGGPCDTLTTTTHQAPLVAAPEIRVWPVPAADVLYFSAEGEWPEPLGLCLYDALGRMVMALDAIRVSPYAKVDLGKLPPGAYFYTLTRKDGRPVKSGKVIRTR